MVIVASLLGEPTPASPHRKRQEDISTTSPKPVLEALTFNDTSSSSVALSSSVSPNTYHSLANQTLNTSLIPDQHKPLTSDHYELEKLDGNGVKVEGKRSEENRTPSPQVRYVPKTDTVTLSFGDGVTDSPVTILPPLGTNEEEEEGGEREEEGGEEEDEEEEEGGREIENKEQFDVERIKDEATLNENNNNEVTNPKISRPLTPPPSALREYSDDDSLERELMLPESVITQQVDQESSLEVSESV